MRVQAACECLRPSTKLYLSKLLMKTAVHNFAGRSSQWPNAGIPPTIHTSRPQSHIPADNVDQGSANRQKLLFRGLKEDRRIKQAQACVDAYLSLLLTESLQSSSIQSPEPVLQAMPLFASQSTQESYERRSRRGQASPLESLHIPC